MTYSFVCLECGHPFTTKKFEQKYCSRTCASQKRKFPKHGKHLLTSDNPCFFHWRIPLEEIQRLMEEKKVSI
jgi:hypothetical protein